MRFLVAIDLTNNMKSWHCNGSRDVKPALAATLLALSLLHAEREVTVVGFPSLPGAPPDEDLIDPVNPVVQAFAPPGKLKAGGGPVYPRQKSLQPMVPLTLNKDLSVVDNLENMSEVKHEHAYYITEIMTLYLWF